VFGFGLLCDDATLGNMHPEQVHVAINFSLCFNCYALYMFIDLFIIG